METVIDILVVGVLIFAIWFMVSKKSKIPNGQVVNDPLSIDEKVIVWVISIFNPIWGGAILYYGWRKKLPIKAKQANTISFAAFGILIILGIIYVIAGGNIEVI